MADWLEIIDSATDPDAPLTSELAKAWTDNVIAVAEGAIDAPRVQGQSLGNVLVAHGVITNTFLNVTSGIDRAKIIYGDFVIFGSNSGDVRLRLSSDNGATWGATQSIMSNGSFNGAARFSIDVTTGAYFCSWYSSPSGVDGVVTSSGTLTIPAGQVNAIGVTLSDATGEGAGVVFCLGGAA